MKIYTRGGDSGETSLLGGRRVRKSDPRVEAYGTVDELNVAIGVVLARQPDPWLAGQLATVQSDLFAICSVLAGLDDAGRVAHHPKVRAALDNARIVELESAIDQATAEAPPLDRFVVPGGTEVAALLQLACAICRRAERRAVALADPHPVTAVLVYLNRLSDLLFVLARRENARAEVAEHTW
ncbi:MAG: cob(I)yrinic acid a,c-diamide adenosyltransferase [Deltaproteobacteria bacterium]|nr:cob(I)yrinic acid a,c-diamide adenosyltransferase [Deltaproteobacteria bacterium]